MLTPSAALAALLDRPLLIEPAALRAILAALREPSAMSPAPMAAVRGGATRAPSGRVGILAIVGPIEYRPSVFSAIFGGTAITTARAQLQELVTDPQVETIVLVADSPGGQIDGLAEFAYELREARKVKAVVGLVDVLAASAAFWLVAQADVVVGTTSSRLGSVGVWVAHLDESRALDKAGLTITLISAGKNKVLGNPFEPLPAAAREQIQAEVDRVHQAFLQDIAAGRQRGLTVTAVRTGFGESRVFDAAEAQRRGMIDRVFPTTTAASGFAAAGGERRMIQAAQRAYDLVALTDGTPAERRAAEARILADPDRMLAEQQAIRVALSNE
jgi:signal peptide peptidase SppA